MKKNKLGLVSLKIHNFKGIAHGEIVMPSTKTTYDFSDVLAIYGENGSGKTSVIEVFEVLKDLICGNEIREDFSSFFYKNSKLCEIELVVNVESQGSSSEVLMLKYNVVIEKRKIRDKESIIITKETIHAKDYGVANSRLVKIIEFDYDSEDIVITSQNKKYLNDNIQDFDFVKRHVKELSSSSGTSFLFNNVFFYENMFDKNSEGYDIVYHSINSLLVFSLFSIKIIKNDDLYLENIPLYNEKFNFKNNEFIDSKFLTLEIESPNILSKVDFEKIQTMIVEINTVLSEIIPNLTIEIVKFGEVLMENEQIGYKFAFQSNRNGIKIPLKNESTGIIKLFTLTYILMECYSNNEILLLIDEIDASIYEYLLGELMQVLKEGAQGQLIVTSHNLRMLESLGKDNVYFTTTNENNRFIKMKNIKTTNNLRDSYIRSIIVDGQAEELSSKVNKTKIRTAFELFGVEND